MNDHRVAGCLNVFGDDTADGPKTNKADRFHFNTS
jgi:hypothetical protein